MAQKRITRLDRRKIILISLFTTLSFVQNTMNAWALQASLSQNDKYGVKVA